MLPPSTFVNSPSVPVRLTMPSTRVPTSAVPAKLTVPVAPSTAMVPTVAEPVTVTLRATLGLPANKAGPATPKGVFPFRASASRSTSKM